MKYRLDIKKGYVEWFPRSSDQSNPLKRVIGMWGVAGLFVVGLGLAMVGLGWLFLLAGGLAGW